MIVYESPLVRLLYSVLASIAGAITALSFRPFKTMSRTEITLALFVGATFAMFVGPWVAFAMFGNGPVDIRLLGGLFYLMASGSNILIPLAVRKLSGLFGVRAEDVQ